MNPMSYQFVKLAVAVHANKADISQKFAFNLKSREATLHVATCAREY